MYQRVLISRSDRVYTCPNGETNRLVAFTSARPCDGGLGAVYVLLRRKRHEKKDVRVIQGAGS